LQSDTAGAAEAGGSDMPGFQQLAAIAASPA
jgi:hypothetical protein